MTNSVNLDYRYNYMDVTPAAGTPLMESRSTQSACGTSIGPTCHTRYFVNL